MNRRKLGAVAGLGVLLLLSIAAAGCGDEVTRVGAQDQSQKGISVNGEGKVSGKPDIANLTLGVMAEASTVQGARDQAAASLDAMIKSLKANGVDDKDIQTQQLSIQPQYDYNNNKQELRGFQVTNIVSVKLRDINKTSQVVDDAVTAGGNNTTIQNLAFTIDNPTELQKQAREAAVADAKAKAETLAKAAGVNVGEALFISESSYSPGPYYLGANASAELSARDAAPATPIQAGELDVIINVSVTWNIN